MGKDPGTSLTPVEACKLENLEEVIEGGLKSFVEVGRALGEIRDGRLYRQSHERFEDYCRERWGMDRTYAHRVMDAADISDRLLPIGNTPTNESQVRPLTKLPEEEQAEAWQEAVELAPDGAVTAKHVTQVVNRRLAAAAEEPAVIPLHDVPSTAIACTDLANLAGQKFRVIYADPPWQYGNQATRASTDNHYDTMSIDDICAMPVKDLVADTAHCHLWTTNAFLQDSFRVLEAWGFEYRSVFVWVKPQMGIGNYWRVSHEFMVLGVRGEKCTFADKGLMSWGQFDRGKHSAKPEMVRQYIERAAGRQGPYLELFGRHTVPGWTVFGNQVQEARNLFA